MDLITGPHWHGVSGHEDNVIEERPHKRLRTSKSCISVLQPVTRLVRSPLDTIGSIAESLGYASEDVRAQVSDTDREKQLELLRLQGATSYEEWRKSALRLDELEGAGRWKAEDTCNEYDVELVKTRLRNLEDARSRRDFDQMRYQIRTVLTRDLGGLGNVNLYKHSRIGTKALIERYIDTVIATIEMVVEDGRYGLSGGREARDLWEDMKSSRQAFGRSGLLLSGGGTLGMNHIGVIKALFEAGVLPRIISGASAGSIVCAVLCTKTDAEIPEVLQDFCRGELDVFEKEGEPQSLLFKVKRLLTEGAIYDIVHLKRVMEGLLGNMTFLEAYNRTRRILNIGVTSAGLYEMPRLLNYITAPDVIIYSAVAASCSVPVVFSAADLLAKDSRTGEIKQWDESPSKWIDGSVDNDLPMTRLSEMLNVNHFIVSQVNPHVVPFLAKEEDDIVSHLSTTAPVLAPGSSWFNSVANLAKGEALHRMHVLAELGIFPNVMTKFRSVLGQRYAGDITIMPEISYTQFPSILRNPTSDFMTRALANGERATWPKLSRIRNHLAVELKLDWAVQKSLTRMAFSQSQVDLRMNAFTQAAATSGTERGRSRRGSRASNKSAYSTILPRTHSGRQMGHRINKSSVEPHYFPLTVPATVPKIAGPEPVDYFSSTDDAHSPPSTSPTPVSDDYDSSDVDSKTSASPPSPLPQLWPTTRQLSSSTSQPATPSIASKTFILDSPTSTRTPTPTPASLTMTPNDARPSSPETRYKKLFHGRLSPMPTIRSHNATPEPDDEEQESRPGLFRRRSKPGMNIDVSGARSILRRRKRSMSTGLRQLRPPEKR